MKKLNLLFFLFFILQSTYSQNRLTIEIIGLHNNKGNVLYELFDQNKKSLQVGTELITNNKCLIVFENIKSGNYGFNYIHDENENKKLDTKMLFIPTEGFGYSNNADGTFGPPNFKKWVFNLSGNMKMDCKITYLKF